MGRPYLNKKKAPQQLTVPEMPPVFAPRPVSYLGMYLCDPSANDGCSKENCVMLGGSCFYTKDRGCALPERGTVEMLTPERLMQMQMLVRGTRPIVTFPFILEAKHE